MRTTTGLRGVAVALLALAAVTSAEAQTGKGSRPDLAAVHSRLKTWPKASREAAEYMMKKYGPPAPDDSPAPFTLKPLTRAIPANAADHVAFSMALNAASFPSGTATVR